MKVKKGDIVKVKIGKDRGRQGRVLKVLPEENGVIVEDINMYKKHIRGDGKEKESAIVDVVKPIDASNVRVICEACGEPTRIGYKEVDGKKVRICKKCDKPVSSSKASNKKGDKKSNKTDKDGKNSKKKNNKKDSKKKSKSKKSKEK
jgi:large subunit ribosomal protein L24